MGFGLFRKNEAVSTVRVNYNGKQAEKGLGSLKKTIATVITAAVIKQVGEYTLNLANLGAQANLVNKNFENWAKKGGTTTEAMLVSLRKATLGMVSDMELQQRAMQAMIAGVDFGDIVTSMEFVTKFALATGTDISQKMQTTMTGLARGSAQFLDDIGIQVIGSKDVVNDAIDQMKEKMDQFTSSEEDAAVKSKQLQVEMRNLSVSIGKKLQPAFVSLLGLINDTIDGWEELLGLNKADKEASAAIVKETQDLRELRKEQQMIVDTQKALRSQGGSLFSQDQLEQAENNIASINEELRLLNKEAGKIAGTDVGEIDIPVIKAPKKDAAGEKAEAARKKRNEQAAKFLDDQVVMTNEAELEMLNIQNNAANDRVEITEEEWSAIMAIQRDALNVGKTAELIAHEEKIALLEFQKDLYPNLEKEINKLIEDEEKRHADEMIKEQEKVDQAKIDSMRGFVNTAMTINSFMMDMSDRRTQRELKNLEQQELGEKEHEKQKKKIEEEGEKRRRAFAIIQQGVAIAEATIDALKAGTGALADTPGGAISRAASMATAISMGFATVAKIQAESFQTGRQGNVKRSRQADNILAVIGQGERVIPAPQNAAHEETLNAIQNNTANTAQGMAKIGRGGGIVNNFYGTSTEQVLQVQVSSKRNNWVGNKI